MFLCQYPLVTISVAVSSGFTGSRNADVIPIHLYLFFKDDKPDKLLQTLR